MLKKELRKAKLKRDSYEKITNDIFKIKNRLVRLDIKNNELYVIFMIN